MIFVVFPDLNDSMEPGMTFLEVSLMQISWRSLSLVSPCWANTEDMQTGQSMERIFSCYFWLIAHPQPQLEKHGWVFMAALLDFGLKRSILALEQHEQVSLRHGQCSLLSRMHVPQLLPPV